jgi:hypothetical protein
MKKHRQPTLFSRKSGVFNLTLCIVGTFADFKAFDFRESIGNKFYPAAFPAVSCTVHSVIQIIFRAVGKSVPDPVNYAHCQTSL